MKNPKPGDSDFLGRDKDGLYIHASNYQEVRDKMNGHSQYTLRDKLNRIPKWIRRIFNAL